MNVVQFPKGDPETLKNFLDEIAKGGTRPMIYLGLGEDGEPVLHTMPMTWKEKAYLKSCFEMHYIRDWLGLLPSSPKEGS